MCGIGYPDREPTKSGNGPSRRATSHVRMARRCTEGKEKPMGYRPLSWVAALDGGTTNTRVRLLHDGQVVAVARRGVGVRDAVLGAASGERALEKAIRDAIAEVLRAAGKCTPRRRRRRWHAHLRGRLSNRSACACSRGSSGIGRACRQRRSTGDLHDSHSVRARGSHAGQPGDRRLVHGRRDAR